MAKRSRSHPTLIAKGPAPEFRRSGVLMTPARLSCSKRFCHLHNKALLRTTARLGLRPHPGACRRTPLRCADKVMVPLSASTTSSLATMAPLLLSLREQVLDDLVAALSARWAARSRSHPSLIAKGPAPEFRRPGVLMTPARLSCSKRFCHLHNKALLLSTRSVGLRPPSRRCSRTPLR
jgi:hypothetical protein